MQEREFCAAYLANGCRGGDAAKAVGYSGRSAAAKASELLKSPAVIEHLAGLRAELEARQRVGALGSIEGVRAWWIAVIEGRKMPDATPTDRIRCSGMLAKSLGAFVEKIDATVTVRVEYADEAEAL